jgi:hypothetical protein
MAATLVLEGGERAGRSMAEAEVGAHDDLADVQAVDQHPVDEVLRAHGRHLRGEVQDVDDVGARLDQQVLA